MLQLCINITQPTENPTHKYTGIEHAKHPRRQLNPNLTFPENWYLSNILDDDSHLGILKLEKNVCFEMNDYFKTFNFLDFVTQENNREGNITKSICTSLDRYDHKYCVKLLLSLITFSLCQRLLYITLTWIWSSKDLWQLTQALVACQYLSGWQNVCDEMKV